VTCGRRGEGEKEKRTTGLGGKGENLLFTLMLRKRREEGRGLLEPIKKGGGSIISSD